jgi:TolB protein
LKRRTRFWIASSSLPLLLGVAGGFEFTHRYPKVEGWAHHIYLEGYELPVLNAGPSDPAPSPDGKSLAFSARGWLWLLDLSSGRARRLTDGPSLDFRPAWSPDGGKLAFVRDDGRDTSLVELDLTRREEKELVQTPAIDLDPAFSRDGRFLYYSSAEGGDLDVWRMDLESQERQRLTADADLELAPLPLPHGERLIFLHRQRTATDRLVLLDRASGKREILREESKATMARPALSPDGRRIALNWPSPAGYDLWLTDLVGLDPIRLTSETGLPLTPAWAHDGSSVYFVEADAAQRFQLKAVPVGGGAVREVPVTAWDWGEPTARLTIQTKIAGQVELAPARLSVLDRQGHPALPDVGQARFDSQSGRVYFYSPGSVTVELPAGEVQILATHGFAVDSAKATRQVKASQSDEIVLELNRLWDSRAAGWYSGDHHYHLNYGGPYRLVPEDLILPHRGEDLDVGTPLMANLHHRFNDLEWFDWRRLGPGPPLLVFGQEVRSHFLGHLGLIGIASPFWPWYWGPGYAVYGDDDRPNAEALKHSRREGGVNTYVHPVSRRDPFAGEEALAALPLELVPDALLGDLDTLDVACLWSDELGTSALWYRLLNLGLPIAPSAGTDAFPNFYRSMALGTTRVYVRPEGPLNMESYLSALRRGRSFVTTGPLVLLSVSGVQPGEVATVPARGELAWELRVISPIALEKVELVVNGQVVWSGAGLSAGGEEIHRGKLRAPSGGWIAARVHGGVTEWPAMDSYPFAHTAPIWLNERGSTDPTAAGRSATELLRALTVAERRLAAGYGDAPIPRLRARFAEARRKLEAASGHDSEGRTR